MVVPFRQSAPGRLLLVAAACFLGAAAALLISGSIYAIGIGMPLGITVAFVGVGLGIGEYTRETLYTVALLPPLLWGFYYLMAELSHVSASGWGWPMAIIAALALGVAAFPGGSRD